MPADRDWTAPEGRAELRRLFAEAIVDDPLPWRTVPWGGSPAFKPTRLTPGLRVEQASADPEIDGTGVGGFDRDEAARYSVAAATALPALLDALDRDEALLRRAALALARSEAAYEALSGLGLDTAFAPVVEAQKATVEAIADLRAAGFAPGDSDEC